MRLNEAGINLIKSFEGCKLTSYLDVGGIPTIGYGHTDGVVLGMTISQDVADMFLGQDVNRFVSGVRQLVKVDLNENQFSALVCFSYNVGLKNLEKSTLLRCVNARMWDEAAKQFLVWDKVNHIMYPGLHRRREAEAELFKTTV